MPSPSRRSVLVLGAVAGVLSAAGCTGGGADPHRTARPDPDLPLRRRAVAATDTLLAAYDTVIAGPGADRADRLRELRADVAAHRAALARGLPAASGTASPSGAATAPPSPAAAPVRSVAGLAAAERSAAGDRLADLEAASPELARLLASVSAADALHAAALGDRGPIPGPAAAASPAGSRPPAVAPPSTGSGPAATASAAPAGATSATTVPAPAVAALQSALAAEHAAVYGYGVVGARLPAGPPRDDARACYTAHEALRDALERAVGTAGATPAAAAAGYRLPFAVDDADGAARLAAHIEGRLTTVYADAVAATTGPLRRTAAAALRETALRAVRWGAVLPALPGLPDPSDPPSGGAPSGGPHPAAVPDASPSA